MNPGTGAGARVRLRWIGETDAASSLALARTPPAAIATPDKLAASLGAFQLRGGIPTADTVDKVYDDLALSRGVQSFMDRVFRRLGRGATGNPGRHTRRTRNGVKFHNSGDSGQFRAR